MGSAEATAGDLIPPKVMTMTPTGINISNTAFTFTNTDLSIGTLSLERFYSAMPGQGNDPNGKNYLNLYDPDIMFFGLHSSNNFDIFVTPAYTHPSNTSPYGRPQVHMGQASSGMFLQPTFTGTTGYFGTDTNDAGKGQLRLVNGAYEYTDSTGAVYLFNPNIQVAKELADSYNVYSQRIASITFPDGRVRTFSYVSGLLKLVSDSSGYAIVFDYGANGFVSAACGFNLSQTYVDTSTTCASASLKVVYGYGTTASEDYLSSFTDTLGQTTSYTVGSAADNVLITCVKPPGYSSCKIANSWSFGSVTQTLADGTVWTSTSSQGFRGGDTDDPGLVEQNINGGFTDPNGKGTSVVFTGTSPYSMTDANGQTTQYRFTGGNTIENELAGVPDVHFGSILQSITLPEGNQYLPEYNGPFLSLSKETWKAKPGSGQSDVVVQYGYASGSTVAQMVHPIWVRDANGNQTDFTYAAHGGVLTEMKPAPSTGAARPLKLTTWVQKYAYIKNSGGSLVAAASPIWVINSETECQTAAGSSSAVCDTSAPQRVTSYEYGADGTANNLNVRGIVVTADGQSRRSCYSYDNNGNRISETKPRAGLAVCP